ncbi:hypothetical protein DM860_009962 [Cuscuta australis]|uniref:Uncharacterized protein n=1 Tax=Cuscuta australis TaxID=267555 RepID=A0A328DD66_9ASTE|nr:hypothetical protein DM860_009962 [Cuscuta australis]
MTVESNRPPLAGDPVVGYPINHPPPPPGAAAFLDGAPPPSLRHDKNFNPHSQQLDRTASALPPARTRPNSGPIRCPSPISTSRIITSSRGNWDLRFTVRNRNRELDIDYEHICAEILYDSAPLAQAIVRPFYLGPKDETSSEARFAADGTVVKDWIVERVNREKPYIEFNVRLGLMAAMALLEISPEGLNSAASMNDD